VLAVSATAVVVIVAVVVIIGWWVDVQRRPIRRCPSCNGSKKNAGSSSLRWGTCRRCGGKGEVRRRGAPGSN
jgi:DnaJ-class molecular chaperone